MAAAHWAHSDSVWPATLIPELARYHVLNFAAVPAVMTMFPLRSQPGEPAKIESDRPRVPWLSMHWTSRAGASELRNCPTPLLVGVGIGGGPDEHAVAAQASRRQAAAGALRRRSRTAAPGPAGRPGPGPGRPLLPLIRLPECDRLYYRHGRRRGRVRGERRG